MEKTVFITGANKGIGFGIAKHLGLCGWRVIIGARNEQRAEKVIGELQSQGIDVLGWVHIELKDLDGIDKAAKEAGITKISHVDSYVKSYFFGIVEEQITKVYGE
mgnify:CR=1 FL=1